MSDDIQIFFKLRGITLAILLMAKVRPSPVEVGTLSIPLLGGGFKYLLFSSLPGEMIQFDEHIFSNG